MHRSQNNKQTATKYKKTRALFDIYQGKVEKPNYAAEGEG